MLNHKYIFTFKIYIFKLYTYTLVYIVQFCQSSMKNMYCIYIIFKLFINGLSH